MNQTYSVTYRYNSRRAAIRYIVATMTLQVALGMSAADLVELVEHAHTDIQVIGVERG